MFHSRKLNDRSIKNIHEGTLKIVYKDDKLSFQVLFIEHNSLTIHHRNVSKIVTEIFIVTNDDFEFIKKPYSLLTKLHFWTKCGLQILWQKKLGIQRTVLTGYTYKLTKQVSFHFSA